MNSIKGSLPSVITFSNLSLGVISILITVNNDKRDLFFASLLIMIAALTDRFDGKVARMLDVTSEFGKELDSLSDLISFGVAPIIIAWKINYTDMGMVGYLLAIIFPIAGAYRLARYNITTFDNVFRGIPITLAGAFLTIDNLYNNFALLKERYNPHVHSLVSAVIIILLSFLMVSKIRFRKV